MSSLSHLAGTLEVDGAEQQDGQDRLRELDQRRNGVVAFIEHELGNITAGVRVSSAGLLCRWEVIDEADRRRLVSNICDGAKRLGDQLGDLVELAAISSWSVTFGAGTFDFATMVRRTVIALAGGRGRVDVQIDEPLRSALADEATHARLLRSNVAQALRWSPSSVVEIAVAEHLGMLHVRISPRDADHARRTPAFDRLHVEVCRAVVEAQGGAIQVDDIDGGARTIEYSVPAADG
jgi:K+-sensing histidine kinase KdpD